MPNSIGRKIAIWDLARHSFCAGNQQKKPGAKLLADDFGVRARRDDSDKALSIDEQIDLDVFGLHAQLFEFFAAACVLLAEGFHRYVARRPIDSGPVGGLADGRKSLMSPAQIDPESGCRIPLPRREDLDPEGQKAFDFYTSGTLRGLHGPAGIWLHSPKLAELYQP